MISLGIEPKSLHDTSIGNKLNFKKPKKQKALHTSIQSQGKLKNFHITTLFLTKQSVLWG